MIHKVIVCFSVKKTLKDQVIIEEGSKNTFLYLIREGEFELTKRVKKDA
jgi:hypothetical protein